MSLLHLATFIPLHSTVMPTLCRSGMSHMMSNMKYLQGQSVPSQIPDYELRVWLSGVWLDDQTLERVQVVPYPLHYCITKLTELVGTFKTSRMSSHPQSVLSTSNRS